MPTYFEFEARLSWIEPPIWRRFLLSTDATFADLHDAMQRAFDWDGSHSYIFRHAKAKLGILCEDPWLPDAEVPADALRLDAFFTRPRGGERCVYRYDFGDNWTHEIKRVARRTEPEVFMRRLLDGARASPLEDCGGTYGYETLATRVMDLEAGRESEVGADLDEWIGDWHPERFDLEAEKEAFDR